MSWFNKRSGKPEARDSVAAVQAAPEPENGGKPVEVRSQPVEIITQSDPQFAQIFNMMDTITDEVVTIETAMGVPAFGCAVNFLSRTLASVPLKVWEKTDNGREAKGDDPIGDLLNHAANDEMTAFDLRRLYWVSVFTEGRGLSFIERNGRGEAINLWPLDVAKVTVQRVNGRKRYVYQDGARKVHYSAADVLDVAFFPTQGGLGSLSPVYQNADTIGMARAAKRYGAKVFNRGGVPPFVIEGPMETAGGIQRAADDLTRAVEDGANSGKPAVAVPAGHKLTQLGFDPEKMQMTETQRFLIEEFARIFTMPPAFLADLTHGTFSNVEQQDLQLVKHVISHWATAFEKEVNLKIFGRRSNKRYAEHVLEGLLRGDLKTRAEAGARMITTGQATPDEIREIENRPKVPGGDRLYMQGAMMPADKLGATPNNEGNNGEKD